MRPIRTVWYMFLIALLGSLAASSAAQAAESTIDRFPIGIYEPPDPVQTTDARYAEIAEMNANLIIGDNGLVTHATNEAALNLSEKYGLKFMGMDWGLVSKSRMIQQRISDGNGYVVKRIQTIGQTFHGPTDNPNSHLKWFIGSIAIKLDVQQWPAGAKLNLCVYDSPLKTKTMGCDSVASPIPTEYAEFWINQYVDSANTSFYLELATHTDHDIGNILASKNDVYADGQAYVNGQPQTNDLYFEVRFSKEASAYSEGARPTDDYLKYLTDNFKDKPAFYGYNLRDEPSFALMHRLEDATKKLKEYDPDHKVYVNLFPNYGSFEHFFSEVELRHNLSLTTGVPLGQTFRTESNEYQLSTIRMFLNSGTWTQDEKVKVTLWDSADKTELLHEQVVDKMSNDWPIFYFNVSVQPDTEYYFELEHLGGGDGFIGSVVALDELDRYGSAYLNGVMQQQDLYFIVNQLFTPFSYEDYIYRWLQTKPDVLAFDNYPFMSDGSMRSNFYENLEIIRKQSLRSNTDFWSFVQSTGIEGLYRQPTEQDMRLELYSNLAYGTKGLLYYTYFTGASWAAPYFGALILPDGTRNVTYEYAKKLNAEVLALGPALKKLTSKAVYHSGEPPQGTNRLPDDFFFQPTNPDHPAVISQLEGPDGQAYVMVVNRGTSNGRVIPFTLPGKPAAVMEVSKVTGEEINTNYNTETGELSAGFDAGEGRLFIIYENEAPADVKAPAWEDGSELWGSAVGETGVTLSWTPATDNWKVTGYRIYVNNELRNTISGDSTEYEVQGLQPDTGYAFKVEAGDAAGNWSQDGPEVMVTTKAEETPEDREHPAWPDGSNLSATDVGQTSLQLTWTPAQDNRDVVTYQVYKGNDVLTSVSGSVYGYYVTRLEPGTTYLFKVKAGDAAGNWSTDGPEVTVITNPTIVVQQPSTSNPAPSTQVDSSPKPIVNDRKTVDESVWKNVKNGKATIRMSKGEDELRLPAHSAILLGSNRLEVITDGATMLFPSDVFSALTALLGREATKDDLIVLKTKKLDENATAELMNGNSGRNTVLKAGNGIYELSLSLVDKDGKEHKLEAFNKPVDVEFYYDRAKGNEGLLGVYTHNEKSGQWEFINGTMNSQQKTVVVQLRHFSKYAVLEYNQTFNDVPDTHWVNKALQVLAAKHVIEGMTETTFVPGGKTTRAEFAAMLSRLLDLKSRGTAAFTDVDSSQWYADAVGAAYEAKLIEGKSSTTFAPNDQISREEMTVILVRAFYYKSGKTMGKAAISFTDNSQISDWAVEYIQSAVYEGLMEGLERNRFSPSASASRAEVAQAIYNFLQKI